MVVVDEFIVKRLLYDVLTFVSIHIIITLGTYCIVAAESVLTITDVTLYFFIVVELLFLFKFLVFIDIFSNLFLSISTFILFR